MIDRILHNWPPGTAARDFVINWSFSQPRRESQKAAGFWRFWIRIDAAFNVEVARYYSNYRRDCSAWRLTEFSWK